MIFGYVRWEMEELGKDSKNFTLLRFWSVKKVFQIALPYDPEFFVRVDLDTLFAELFLLYKARNRTSAIVSNPINTPVDI